MSRLRRMLALGMLSRHSSLYRVIAGPIVVTPTESANLAGNPGFETAGAGGADVFGTWGENVAGTSTVNRETSSVHGGASAARLDTDASGSLAQVNQTVSALNVGEFFRASIYTKCSAASKTAVLGMGATALTINLPTADYARFFYTHRLPTTDKTLLFRRNNAAASISISIYGDDAEVVRLTNVFQLWPHVKNCGVFQMKYTPVAGTLIGLVFNADDPTNPQNYTRVVEYLNASTVRVLALEKVVSGTLTTVAEYALAPVADAPLTVTRYENGTLDIAYNGVVLAAGVAAQGNTGLYWGILNTHSENVVSEVSADSRDCALE